MLSIVKTRADASVELQYLLGCGLMSFKASLVELILLTTIILISTGLFAMQYKWTNDIATAELTMAENLLKNQTESLCDVFDQQLTSSCLALIPHPTDVSILGFEEANLNCFNGWKASRHRPIFLRIGVVVPEEDRLKVFLIDPRQSKLAQVDPPSEWSALITNLAHKRLENSRPYDDASGMLIEHPVFGPRALSLESQWTVLELDQNYLKKVWIPELLDQFLNSDVAQAEIRNAKDPASILFSSGAHSSAPAAISIPFNLQGHGVTGPLGPRRAAWIFEVWPNTHKLQEAIARARCQSLALALALDFLILWTVYILVRYTRRSRQLAEAQMNFVAATSHELRTPLTVIRGAAHNLAKGIVSEPKQIAKYAGMIERNAEQLTDMLEQVLAFAHSQQTQLKMNSSPVRLKTVIERATEALRYDSEEARVSVETSFSDEAIIISGDETSLVRAIQNVILNAIKHAGIGGWVGIRVREIHDEKVVQISVVDRGPGIAEKDLEKIFKPFYRSDATVAKQIRGSGIGLGLVKEIVKMHRGYVTAVNRPEGGAEFIIKLPMTQKEQL